MGVRAKVAAAGTGVVAAAIIGFAALTGPASKTLDVTWSKGECQAGIFCVNLAGPVDYDLVRIKLDCNGTCDYNALGLSTGATGRIGRIEILTEGEDCVKVRGADTLDIDGGYCTADARRPTSHQDCVQALSGRHVHFTGVIFSCTTANNAQWYMGSNATAPPGNVLDVVCDHCEFHPGGLHSVTIGPSTGSGVKNSLVCPGSAPGLQFVTTGSVNTVDIGNYKPANTSKTWPYSTEPRCQAVGVTEPTDTVPTSTTTSSQSTTTSAPATTTQQATTTSSPATTTTQAATTDTTTGTTTDVATVTDPSSTAAASALIADGFSVLKSGATLYAKWKAANPGESAKLDAYLIGGGAPPKLVTKTGQALVEFAEARARLAA